MGSRSRYGQTFLCGIAIRVQDTSIFLSTPLTVRRHVNHDINLMCLFQMNPRTFPDTMTFHLKMCFYMLYMKMPANSRIFSSFVVPRTGMGG